MGKTFTVDEAQMLLPVLGSLLERARGMVLKAGEIDLEMQALSQKIYLSGGMMVDVVSAARRRGERDKSLQVAKETVAEIDEIGVQVQDLEEGLLDFPCMVGQETVMLCWKLGEESIAHWHGVDEDAEARRPLDGRFGRSERPN